MTHLWRALLVAALVLAALPADAAGPFLVADLDTTRLPGAAFNPALPVQWAEAGGVLYFAADDGQHGAELWRTDGSSAGTRMVSDLCPGPCSSSPGALAAFGDRVAFTATDGFHGIEIWLSDGTRAGTRMPRDLCPGLCANLFQSWAVAVDDLLFFGAYQQGGRYFLGVTDGTPAGTRWLLETEQYVAGIGNLQGRLAFVGPGAHSFSTLWLSDGTPQGTSPAVDLCAGQGTPATCPAAWTDAHVVGDRILFFQHTGARLWVSDGTPQGTREVASTLAPPFHQERIVWRGALYFSNAIGLWRSDGTPEGTVRLRSFPYQSPSLGLWSPRSLVPLGDSLYFIAGDFPRGLAVWRTQGTPESTVLAFDPTPGSESPDLGSLARAGDRILVPVLAPSVSELWEIDGSAPARPVTRLCGTRQILCSGDDAPLSPVGLGDLYLFGLTEEKYGTELWALDGSGLRLVRDISRQPGSSRVRALPYRIPGEPAPRDIAALGDRIVFAARRAPSEPAHLWASDGSAAGTAEIGPGIEWPHALVRIGDHLWLRGSWPDLGWPYLYGNGIWKTDGTAAGTTGAAASVSVDSIPGGRPGLVLFAGADLEAPHEEQTGTELWAARGAPQENGLLKEINEQPAPDVSPGEPIPGSSLPALFEPLGDLVLFAADDGLHGLEPWITDGTAVGTRLLLNLNPAVWTDGIRPEPLPSDPGPFVRFGARAFFAADDGVHGRELWSTDGTAAGTALARDLHSGAASSNPRALAAMGSRLYLLADGGAGDALWAVQETGEVRRVRLLGNGRRASGLMAAGDRLFFVVDGPATGPELWTSDGTRRGTRMVRDIRPGAPGSYPRELTAVDGLLLFAADDGVHGQEPWVSDGTAAGTRLLADLSPGVSASGPAGFSVAGDFVGFDADDGIHGREVWAVATDMLVESRH